MLNKSSVGVPAPCYVDQLFQALATAPGGMKPRPVSANSPDCERVPVKLLLVTDSGELELDCGFVLSMRIPADREKGRAERKPRLTLTAMLPEGWQLTSPQEVNELIAEVSERIEVAQSFPMTMTDEMIADAPPFGIEEFRGVSPDVFKSDPERHSESMRELNKKRLPGSGGEQ